MCSRWGPVMVRALTISCCEYHARPRAVLLASVTCLGVLGAGPALAAWPGPGGPVPAAWLSVGEDFLTARGASQPLLQPGTGTPAASDRVRQARQFRVQAGFGLGDVLPGWDVRLGYTGLRAETHRLNATGGSGTLTDPAGGSIDLTSPVSFSSSIRQSMAVGDVDLGKPLSLPWLDLRPFAGLRFADFNQPSQATLLGGEGAVERSCSHYFGFGPRLGASASRELMTLGEASLSFTAELSGAVLFGRTSHRASLTTSGTGADKTYEQAGQGRAMQPVYNAETALGVQLSLPVAGHTLAAGLGYRAAGWWNIVNTKVVDYTLAGSGGTITGNQFYQGPYMNLTLSW